MYRGLNGVELGFVVSMDTLERVLTQMSSPSRLWWIQTDREDAVPHEAVVVSCGHPSLESPINTVGVSLPVLNDDEMHGLKYPVVLIEPSAWSLENPEVYRRAHLFRADFDYLFRELFDGVLDSLISERVLGWDDSNSSI